jgi:hypothetical protein
MGTSCTNDTKNDLEGNPRGRCLGARAEGSSGGFCANDRQMVPVTGHCIAQRWCHSLFQNAAARSALVALEAYVLMMQW